MMPASCVCLLRKINQLKLATFIAQGNLMGVGSYLLFDLLLLVTLTYAQANGSPTLPAEERVFVGVETGFASAGLSISAEGYRIDPTPENWTI